MGENKKRKINNMLIGIGLIVLILFVIITTIIINFKQNDYNNIKDENDKIEDQLPDDNNVGVDVYNCGNIKIYKNY